MKRLKDIKEKILDCVHCQVEHSLETTDTKELGEAVDMIKDITEAMYYCTVIEAMEEGNHEYIEHKGLVHHHGQDKDIKHGKSYLSRKHYLDLKENGGLDKNTQMHELEQYIHDLSDDVLEIIQDLAQEEKTMLSQKIMTLAGKIR